MNIRDWPLGQIMQLPDCCFGRRFAVCLELAPKATGVFWDIGEVALPEKCVLWELVIDVHCDEAQTGALRLALGDQLPTTTAMMDALDPLIMGLGIQGADPRTIEFRNELEIHLRRLRVPILAAGRRLILEVSRGPVILWVVNVMAVFSSMPTEVPDCLVSEYLRSR